MISEVDYHGWKSLQLVSGEATLVLPLDIGPRVLSCRLGDGPNLFHNVEADLGGRNEPDWRLRGGHRIWHAPEAKPRTYDPDNRAVKVKTASNQTIRLAASRADPAGIRKTLTVESLGEESFRVTHHLENQNAWPVRFAPWALTVMEAGGDLVLPLLPKGSHEDSLLPKYAIVPWAYTDLSLPCWQIQGGYLRLQSGRVKEAQKVGLTDYPGWLAYWQKSGTFFKRSNPVREQSYPDLGCCVEVFANDFMVEMETLGALAWVEPGQTLKHEERWKVVANLPRPTDPEAFKSGLAATAAKWL